MKRQVLTDLFQWLKSPNRKPLVLRGARQVGKSTAVRMLADEAGYNLVEINLERHLILDHVFATYDLNKILASIEAISRKSLIQSRSILFLDEIQATPQAISALRYFFEEMPQLPVIAAGSLLEQVLGKTAIEIPVGRIQYLYMGPLTFEEYLEAKGEDFFLQKIREFSWKSQWSDILHQQGLELIKEFILVGGMPGAAKCWLNQPQSVMHNPVQLELQSIVDTFKDDFSKYSSRSVLIPVLQQVYDRAPRYLSKQIQINDLAPDFRHEYIKSAISLLSAARVLTLAKRNDASGIPLGAGQREKSPKLFWLDIGLANRMLNLESSWLSQDLALIHGGAIAEQFVAQHLFYQHGCYIPPSLHYWQRDGKSDAAEVDFVIQWNSEIIPIEVKSGSKGSLRSLHQYLARKKKSLAIRFDAGMPNICEFNQAVKIDESQDVKLKARLASIPLYMVGQLHRLLGSLD